ncbi:MAG: MFS transporter, partial [Pyrinomonadaceae bacterium]|nr:MFS transporter [Pyrinomonadaceae bacterium]
MTLPRNIFAISFVSLLNDASSEIIYPFLPLFLALTLGASPAAIGIIEGTAESVSSFLKLFAGYWSDRRGRRKGLVVFGYALASFARPLLAFATTWQHVLAIRLSDRIGKGIRSAPRDAMIADAAPFEQRGLAFGFHRAMDHTGAVIGPLLGWAILWWVATNANAPTAADYTKVFLLASVPALAAVLVAAFAVREPRKTEAERTELPAPPKLSLRGFDTNFRRFLLILALFTLSNSSDAFLILRAQESGVRASHIPLLWAALHVCKVVSSLVGGGFSDRFERRRMIAFGWMFYALVYAGFAYATSTLTVSLLFIIYGVYFGLTEGTEKALVADLVPAEKRGTAYGLYNLAFSVTVLPASVLMGQMWKHYGAQTAFLVSAAVGTIAAVMLLTLVSSKNNAVEA